MLATQIFAHLPRWEEVAHYHIQHAFVSNYLDQTTAHQYPKV
jgi:hypothetical protein